MNASIPAPSGDLRGVLDRLGLAPDRIVQELGYDDDVDHDFRAAVEERLGAPMEDDGYTGEIDAALLWWRGGDGDLTDALVDLVGLLDDGGYVALLTPRHTADAVEASEIEEAALHGRDRLSACPRRPFTTSTRSGSAMSCPTSPSRITTARNAPCRRPWPSGRCSSSSTPSRSAASAPAS